MGNGLCLYILLVSGVPSVSKPGSPQYERACFSLLTPNWGQVSTQRVGSGPQSIEPPSLLSYLKGGFASQSPSQHWNTWVALGPPPIDAATRWTPRLISLHKHAWCLPKLTNLTQMPNFKATPLPPYWGRQKTISARPISKKFLPGPLKGNQLISA